MPLEPTDPSAVWGITVILFMFLIYMHTRKTVLNPDNEK